MSTPYHRNPNTRRPSFRYIGINIKENISRPGNINLVGGLSHTPTAWYLGGPSRDVLTPVREPDFRLCVLRHPSTCGPELLPAVTVIYHQLGEGFE